MTPSDRRASGRERGLVLLEVLVALVIFATVVLAWASAADSAMEAAAAANQERTLRMLAARKLDEIRACPAGFREGGDGGFEEEVDAGEDNPFLDYAWKVEAKEVVAAGRSDEEGAEHLFKLDEDEDQAPQAPEGGGKPPEAVLLLRLTLTVSHVPRGAEGEEFRVIAYVPAPKDDASGAGR